MIITPSSISFSAVSPSSTSTTVFFPAGTGFLLYKILTLSRVSPGGSPSARTTVSFSCAIEVDVGEASLRAVLKTGLRVDLRLIVMRSEEVEPGAGVGMGVFLDGRGCGGCGRRGSVY